MKRKKTIDDMERRLLMLEKLDKEDVSKVKERITALVAQQDPSEPLIFITLNELARLSRKLEDKDMKCMRSCIGSVVANLCITVLGSRESILCPKQLISVLRTKLGV